MIQLGQMLGVAKLSVQILYPVNYNGVRNNLSSIENYQNRNCKKGEEGTITQI
jgi:hypothetical protein